VSKYEPLGRHLADAAANGEHMVTLSFGEIERIVGALPPSASRRQWWANNSHGQALVWREAGWHVDKVEIDARRVWFARGRVGGTYADRGYVPATTRPLAPRVELAPLDERVDVRVRFEWLDAGRVVLDANRNPQFCVLPGEPGLYRFTFAGRAGDERDARYVGESDNLSRRAGNYRNPGPSQRTSLRLNHLLREHLEAGGSVSFAVATSAEFAECDGPWRSLDLSRKSARLLAENAALVSAQRADVYDLVNLG
jgi:hypothetical protein